MEQRCRIQGFRRLEVNIDVCVIEVCEVLIERVCLCFCIAIDGKYGLHKFSNTYLLCLIADTRSRTQLHARRTALTLEHSINDLAPEVRD